jgi:hypothetical protein
MEKKYYVRVNKDDEWFTADRNGETLLDRETAEDVFDKGKAQDLMVFMFVKETPDSKPIEIKRSIPEKKTLSL